MMSLTGPRGFAPSRIRSYVTHIVGAAGQIRGISFDGTMFMPLPNAQWKEPGKAASWIIFKEPTLSYAVDENSDEVRLFTYDPPAGALLG